MLLKKHQKSKNIILQKFEEIAEIAQDLGMASLAQAIRLERIEKLKNEQFHLVILGEFNHGKSTFVNAMLGTQLLPTGITPTTAVLNHIVYSDSPRAEVLTKDGKEIELAASEISSWLTVSGAKHEDVQRVEIGFPSDLLKSNITLVDTPGVNDLNEQRADITYGYVPRADAVIFLLDATQALKDSEREFLSSHVLEGSKDRLIFILGKIDLLSQDERSSVIDYVRKGLEKFVPNPVIFPLSAKNWLDSRDPESGFPKLQEYLSRFLDTDRSQIVLDNAAEDAQRTAALVQQTLGIKLRALGMDINELEQRIVEVNKQLVASKRQIDELHLRIKAETQAIKSQTELALANFTQAFAQTIVHEIDRVDSNDLKQYLGPFVQDKFKEWSEMQGLVVSQALEKLAEEVITITNENVADAFHSLSSHLGAGQTQVEIDTDSFMYDVGVYAIGALGTTVLLFVNGLAGGLLTLAAPILAIIVKSKVAGDIKEQAKERAPAVILKAGEAMEPFFDERIDAFGHRLQSFVTSAGTNLYKGISEVLEKTVQDRMQAKDAIAPLVTKVQNDSLAIADIRQALNMAREGIWELESSPMSKESIKTSAKQSSQKAEAKNQTKSKGPPPIPAKALKIESNDIVSEESEDNQKNSLSENETRKDLN